jgi:glycosyltransferase involved in cell wall biosynthesis
MQKYDVSIIIPAYNEELLLKSAVEKTLLWTRQYAKDTQIIIAENGSSDATAKIADLLANQSPEVTVLHLPEANFGKAVRAAVQHTKFDRTILFNADWIDTDFMAKTLPMLETNDVVVGSKTLDPQSDHRPYIRKLLSKLLTMIIKTFFHFKGSDTHGLKAFQTKKMLTIVNDCQCLEIIETELLLRAQLGGLRIAEVPVSIEELRPPRLSVIKRCFIVARELWLLSGVLRNIRRQSAGVKHATRG